MAPNENTRWPRTALLTGSTSGPERQYRWPPKARILSQAVDVLWAELDDARQLLQGLAERMDEQNKVALPGNPVIEQLVRRPCTG